MRPREAGRIASRDELANSLSHAVGLAAAVAATPVLIVGATRRGDAADIVGSSIFGATMILLYLISTSYHAAPTGQARLWLQRLDHAAIFVLIAGTYTPFTLGVLGGAWGWTLFGLVWGVAAAGVCAKLLVGPRFPRLSLAAYLLMGWLVVIAVGPLVQRMPPSGIALLLAGGLLYSAGVFFYTAERLPHAHFIWHLFVLAGSACHFFAVLWFAV